MTPSPTQDGLAFNVGDRVLMTGGYDQCPAWLGDGDGYFGIISEIVGKYAAVQLDEEIKLEAHREIGWADFGLGSQQEIGRLALARGQWLFLAHGWAHQEWREPVGRLHVGLMQLPPDFSDLPTGGGMGAWVESHATMTHAAA